MGVETSIETESTEVETGVTVVETGGKTGGEVNDVETAVDGAFINWLSIGYAVRESG